MPKEYNIQPSQASPSPTGFGSSDISLQPTRFVPQTNVAVPQNQYEALQNILGVGVQAIGKSMDYQLAQLQGAISLDKAKAAKEEEQYVKNKRAAAEAANALETDIKAKALSTESVDSLKKQREDAVKRMNAEQDPVSKTALVQAVNMLDAQISKREVDVKQNIADQGLKLSTDWQIKLDTAIAANNLDQVRTIFTTVHDLSQSEPDPKIKAVLADIASRARVAGDSLQAKESSLIDHEETAMVGAAHTAASTAIDNFVADKLKDSQSWVLGIPPGSSAESVKKALMDEFLSDISKKDPYLSYLFLGGNSKEQTAASSAVARGLDPLINKWISASNKKAENDAVDKEISSLSELARTNYGDALAKADESEILNLAGRSAINKAMSAIYTSAINGAPNEADSIVRAFDLIRSGNPTAVNIGKKHINDMIAAAGTRLAEKRYSGYPGTPELLRIDSSTGWTDKYPTADALIEHAMATEFGISKEILTNSTEVQTAFSPFIRRLYSEFQADLSKDTQAQARANSMARAADSAARKTVSAEQVFDGTELGIRLKTNDWNTLTPEQADVMVHDATVGFNDSVPPSKLVTFLKGHTADPSALPITMAFWRHNNPAANPSMAVAIHSDKEMMASYAVSVYAQRLQAQYGVDFYRSPDKEHPNDFSAYGAMVSDFAKNLSGLDLKTANKDDKFTRDKMSTAAYNSLFAPFDFKNRLFWGFRNPGDWFGAYDVNIRPSQIFDALPPDQKATMLEFHTLAQCAGNMSDEDKFALTTDMMRGAGYQGAVSGGYPIIVNVPSVQTAPGKDPVKGLPDSSELPSDAFKKYLEEFKPLAYQYMKEQKDVTTGLAGLPINIESIEPSYNQAKLSEGRSTLVVTYNNGKKFYLPEVVGYTVTGKDKEGNDIKAPIRAWFNSETYRDFKRNRYNRNTVPGIGVPATLAQPVYF